MTAYCVIIVPAAVLATIFSTGIRAGRPHVHQYLVENVAFKSAVGVSILLREVALQYGIQDVLVQASSFPVLICSGLLLGEVVARALLHFIPSTTATPGKSTVTPKRERVTEAFDAKGCRSIINGESLEGEPKNGLNQHESRAIPNQRLVTAFEVKSCFTSSDEEFCGEFRAGVEKLLHVPESRWPSFVGTALTLAEREFAGEDSVNLFNAVQMVTMKTMMYVLFGRDPDDTRQDEQIRTLAKEVNKQWLRSKETTAEGNPVDCTFKDQTALREATEAIFPKWKDG